MQGSRGGRGNQKDKCRQQNDSPPLGSLNELGALSELRAAMERRRGGGKEKSNWGSQKRVIPLAVLNKT